MLDLRSNPGGQLDQAIRMVNLFVPRGSMIVYTDGRVPNSDQEYRATENGEFLTIPMIVMVNRNSASASEIVSGALQDYDRALVVGETTFGKALVQSVYRVSQGAGLALTTARYFTPSGRMIQRPWDGAFDEYLTYTLRDQAERPHTAEQLKLHDRRPQGVQRRRHRARSPLRRSGRGLQSDVVRPLALHAAAVRDLRRAVHGRRRYPRRRPGQEPAASSARTSWWTMRWWRTSSSSWRTASSSIDEAAFTKDKEFIRAMIRYDIDVALFSVAVARQRLIVDDPQAQFALSLFPEAEKLSELSKNRTTKAGQ